MLFGVFALAVGAALAASDHWLTDVALAGLPLFAMVALAVIALRALWRKP